MKNYILSPEATHAQAYEQLQYFDSDVKSFLDALFQRHPKAVYYPQIRGACLFSVPIRSVQIASDKYNYKTPVFTFQGIEQDSYNTQTNDLATALWVLDQQPLFEAYTQSHKDDKILELWQSVKDATPNEYLAELHDAVGRMRLFRWLAKHAGTEAKEILNAWHKTEWLPAPRACLGAILINLRG